MVGQRRGALDADDHVLSLPQDYILAARVSLLLRGMTQLMAQERLSTARAWRHEARRVQVPGGGEEVSSRA